MPRLTVELALFLALLLLEAQAFAAPDHPSDAPAQPTFQAASQAVESHAIDRILVKLKQPAGAKSRAGAGLRVVHLTAGTSVQDALKAYSYREDVEYAEPDHVYTPDAIPNDSEWAAQWAVDRIRAPFAWNTTTGASTVTVCVVDSGVDYEHPDLKPNMHSLVGFNALDGSNKPKDELGHGTAVAGMLGAAGNNGQGVAGVAWQVKLLACKFMDARGVGYSSNALACIQYCTANGAKVIQASFSGGGYSQSVKDAIQAAGDAGVLFVSSAGNKETNLDSTPVYPPAYGLANQLVVASSGFNDELSEFSNFGAKGAHIAAPGEWVYSTKMGGTYDYMSGTSASTPLVSGAAALLLAAAGSDPLPVAQLRQLLLDSATRTEGLNGKVVTGRLDVGEALRLYLASRPASVPARRLLPKSSFCKKKPKLCVLSCNKKNVCQWVKRPAKQAAKAQGGARRLLRGGTW